MNLLRNVWSEVIGLFVDDGALALLVLALIAVVTAAIKLLGLPALLGGVVVLIGCLLVLTISLFRATRSR